MQCSDRALVVLMSCMTYVLHYCRYLIDENSSWLVQISSFLTLALGCYKIVKSFAVKKQDVARGGGESTTDVYDRIAFKYLLPPLVLVVLCYSVWSLVVNYHKGWYSWLLESLVALVYACGFIGESSIDTSCLPLDGDCMS